MSKTVLITGCNRGTGLGIAKVFSNAGYKVVGINRTPSSLTYFEEILCDLRYHDQIEKAADTFSQKYDSLDLLINNAATRILKRVDNLTFEEWKEALDTNLTAPFYLTKLLLPKLISSKGLIVFIGSNSSMIPFEKGVSYNVSKLAIEMLAKVLFIENKYHGVRVSLIVPGAINNKTESDSWKIDPLAIGNQIHALLQMPPEVNISRVELNPATPLDLPFDGIEFLQYF